MPEPVKIDPGKLNHQGGETHAGGAPSVNFGQAPPAPGAVAGVAPPAQPGQPTANAPPATPSTATYALAKTCRKMFTGICTMLGAKSGNARLWQPGGLMKDADARTAAALEEKQALDDALAMYFNAKGWRDLPPGITLALVVGAYVLPRIAVGATGAKKAKQATGAPTESDTGGVPGARTADAPAAPAAAQPQKAAN